MTNASPLAADLRVVCVCPPACSLIGLQAGMLLRPPPRKRAIGLWAVTALVVVTAWASTLARAQEEQQAGPVAVTCDASWPAPEDGVETLFSAASGPPSEPSVTDDMDLVLGLRFQTAVAGDLTAIRYFR